MGVPWGLSAFGLWCLGALSSAASSFVPVPANHRGNQQAETNQWGCQRDAKVLMSADGKDAVFATPSLLCRRRFLVLIGTAGTSQAAVAKDEAFSPEDLPNRPRASLEALIPAMEQRLLLEKSLDLCNQIIINEKEEKEKVVVEDNEERKDQLRAVLENPNNNKNKNNKQTGLLLGGASLRAAMNVYTANLRFAETYVLTASPKVKKAYIRANNGLPDVKQVITADLDLRDLYRNLAQTSTEDAQAELYRIDTDWTELRNLLQQALEATQQWFALIPKQDVEVAKQAVLSGQNTINTPPPQPPKFTGWNLWS